MLEEVYPWGQALRVYSLASLLVSASCMWMKKNVIRQIPVLHDVFPACCYALCSMMDCIPSGTV